MKAIAWLLAAVAGVLPLTAAAQYDPRVFPVTVVEGDAGTSTMTFHVVLDKPSTIPEYLYFIASEGTASEGEDYLYDGAIELEFLPGETEKRVEIRIVGDAIVENDEYFDVEIRDLSGGSAPDGFVRGTIVDDDLAAVAAYAAIDDRFVVTENAAATDLAVLANDLLAGAADGTLTLLAGPGSGTATVQLEGTTPVVEYTPAADASGDDTLTYRYCTAGGACDEATVRIVVRPVHDLTLGVDQASGFTELMVTDLRALPSARFAATPLFAPAGLAFDNGIDPTPASPWDSPAGVTWDLRTLPAPVAGETVTRILVDEPSGKLQALAIGIDADGDGQPSEAEIGCWSASGTSRCELVVPRTAGVSVNYWVLVHNLDDAAREGVVHVYDVPMIASDGTLHATGAGHVERGEDFPLRIGWADDTLRDGSRRAGYVTVYADDGVAVGVFPVVLRVQADGDFMQTAVPLVPGRPHAFALEPNHIHLLTFIDVPAGATRLRVTSTSARNIDLYLVPPSGFNAAVDTEIPRSPTLASARVSATGPTGNEVAEVTSVVSAGRWYVAARNADTVSAVYTLTAQIDATAPVVRDGSYFNDDRSGSGVFLYPAADQWTGLWYTYLQDGTPTWYYLQAPQPGADGIWSSPIYRSAWDGNSNVLVAVGEAVVTPDGADSFQFSYRLDGVAGTQPFDVFGRGCPMNGAIDLSGTWFDPDRAGTGYSVQLFPDYEYYAAYYYDDRGYARFVAAEFDRFGGTEEDLVIQQLDGTCPVCTWRGLPDRTDIGVLRRRILSGTFQYIDTDLEFVAPLSGGWTTTDTVQLLGGPGTTQGCAP